MGFQSKVLAGVLILAGLCGVSHTALASGDGDSGKINLPLVYDPVNKKYFIGGNAKFLLKLGQESSIIDRIEVGVDGGDFKPYDEAIQFKNEGKHTLKFRAKNPVNNWSPVQFTEVFVDLTPPSTEAKWPDGKSFKDETGLYFALGTQLSLVAQDNLSGVGRIEYSWDDNAYIPFLKPIAVEKSGKQTLYFRSVDKVGNAEPTRKLEFIADGTAPSSVMKLMGTGKQITVEGKPYLAVSDGAGFAIESADDLSKVKQVWVALDGDKPIPYLKALYFLKDGPHSLQYFSEDNVGNREKAKLVTLYTVSSAPRTTINTIGRVVNTGGVNFAPRDFAIRLSAQENVAGLDRIEMKIDDESDFRSYVEPVRFTTPGLHTTSYRAVDRVGNVEPTRVYTVHVYQTSPETTMNTSVPLVLRDGLTFSQSPNVISFIVANSTVGIEKTLISIDDAPATSYSVPFTILSDKKVHKITYKSIDKLGNEEATKTVSLHMINTSPVVDLFISDGHSVEEKVRTNLFDQPGGGKAPQREIASPPAKKKK